MRQAMFWLLAVFVAGAGLYQLKYRVQTQEAKLTALNRTLFAQQEALHVLAAEWTYLNRPDRLADLNRRYIKLKPVTAPQMARLDEVPRREATQARLTGETQ